MGTTVQKLQRILETKTGFKDLITEKGGVITEATTFHEYIDEARKLMEGGKVVIEEASATAVPNEGYVEKVYFNTSLSTEQVDKIITDADLPWQDIVDAIAYDVFVNLDGIDVYVSIINLSNLLNDGTTSYAIQAYTDIGRDAYRGEVIYCSSLNAANMLGVSYVGWMPDMETTSPSGMLPQLNPYPINKDASVEMLTSSTHNEALKQIISITPFDGEPFRKELTGTYEAVTTNITENGEVDLTTY